MNILFYRYGSICEPDILEVFQSMQFTVYEETLEIREKTLSASEKLAALTPVLCAHPVDFVFSINFFPFLSELCERLHLFYVCWSVDCPVLELFSNTIKNSCNRIFLFDYTQYETFAPLNPERIFLSAPCHQHQSLCAGAFPYFRKRQKAYGTDVSLVGSLYHEKSPLSLLKENLSLSDYWIGYVNGLIAAQLKIYGSNFLEDAVSDAFVACLKQHFPDFLQIKNAFTDTGRYVAAHYYLGMRLAETERVLTLNELAALYPVTLYTRSDTSLLKNVDCRGGVTTHEQMPKIFHLSKINLNITIRSIQSGLPLRIWDILGCGGFLLSNYQAEIPKYFEIGKDLDCYESLDDLKAKVQYYLAHDDLRREIAANGHEKVKKYHTWEARIAAMLKVLFSTFCCP